MDPKEEGEDKSLLYYQGTNKAIIFSIPKTSRNHTLGQNLLLVATPWVKSPVNNRDGPRIGLNSVTFGQDGLNHICGVSQERLLDPMLQGRTLEDNTKYPRGGVFLTGKSLFLGF